jgi:hypothetical protein
MIDNKADNFIVVGHFIVILGLVKRLRSPSLNHRSAANDWKSEAFSL